MLTPKQIEEAIAARTAEGQSVIERFNKEKARVQKEVDNFTALQAECHTKVTHLNGCIAELQRMLPKPKEKAAKKKK